MDCEEAKTLLVELRDEMSENLQGVIASEDMWREKLHRSYWPKFMPHFVRKMILGYDVRVIRGLHKREVAKKDDIHLIDAALDGIKRGDLVEAICVLCSLRMNAQERLRRLRKEGGSSSEIETVEAEILRINDILTNE